MLCALYQSKDFLEKPLDVCVKCGTMYMTIMTSMTNETTRTPKRRRKNKKGRGCV